MSASSTAAAIGLQIKAVDEASATLDHIKKALGELSSPADKAQASIRKLAAGGLQRVQAGLKGVAKHAGSAIGDLAKFVPALGALTAVASIAGVAKLTEGWAAFGSRIDLTAQRIGMPVEKLGQLETAARLAGASAADADAGIDGLQQTMNAAAFGRDSNAFQAFRLAGIDVGNMTSGARKAADILPRIADEVQRLFKTNPDAAQRFLDFIGVGRNMLFVFKDGRAGLQRYNEEARKLGGVTEEQAAKARELQQAQERLKIAFEQEAYVLAENLGPSLVRLLDYATKFVTGHEKDIGAFFKLIGDGIDRITRPENLKWFGDQIKTVYDTVVKLAELLRAIGDSPFLRRFFGLDSPAAPKLSSPIGSGIPMERDDPVPGALQEVDRNVIDRLWRGGGPLSDPRSLQFRALASASHSPPLQGDLQKLSDQNADFYKVPREFAKAIFGIEHGLKPDGSPAVSPAGAIGAGQLMPAMADDLGVNPYDMSQNVNGSVSYMRQLLDRFHDNELVAAAAYNAGPSNPGVNYFERTGDPSHLPLETQNYVRMLQTRERQGVSAVAGATSDSSVATPYEAPVSGPSSGGARRHVVEIRHVNPPPGTTMVVTEVDPTVDVVGPTVMQSMPNAGPARRSVFRDGH